MAFIGPLYTYQAVEDGRDDVSEDSKLVSPAAVRYLTERVAIARMRSTSAGIGSDFDGAERRCRHHRPTVPRR